MTIIPTKIYFRDGIAKCELSVAKGKKFHDRRESEKQKEAKREANEAIARSRAPRILIVFDLLLKGSHADPT